VEGFSGQKATKIEAHRAEVGNELLCNPAELWAVVSDSPFDVPVPQFSWDDISALADMITRTFPLSRDDELELFINGKWMRTNPFVKQMMGRVLEAMTSTLKGVDKLEEIDLRWKRHG
jgi:hypothetical protein